MTALIRGAGGDSGGGKGGGASGSQRTPTEAANSLFSSSYAKLIDLVSEGEIQGLVNGLKSIYVENTPLQNADDSYNFQNVTVYTRNGTQTQEHIPGFDDVANEVAVGITVDQDTPVIRTITNPSVNAARVTISVPQLQQFSDQGDISGTSVALKIAVQYNGGGFTTVIDDTITGRSGQQYQRQYLVNLSGAFPVELRVTRVTPDSTSAKLLNAFSWSSYTEVTFAKLAYPNSALVGVRIDAEQFNSIPNRSYRIKGIKVKIPSNATVNSTTGALSYSGIWNGTFGAAQWCSDPAWCLWDLLTSKRYGFGNHIDASQLDKFAFYSASQYCGASVPDGFGGTEPRFSCNVNIQTADDAYKLINDMCSVFRAMPYWSTGTLTVSQDRPTDSAYLFTYANVSEEGFSYSGSSLKTRPTVAVVQYMDLSLRNTSHEVVEDQQGISKFGVIKTEITAFACISRGQAHRIGEWLLYSSQYETETVTFTASVDAGALVRPGQVIEISDPVRAGARRGGRIRSATTTAITVDDATGLSATNAPTLSVILSNGTVQVRSVGTVVGNVITVSSAFSSAPNANSVWIFQSNDLKTTTWRVLGIQEQDQCQYAITALAYNASKYSYIERGAALQTRDVTNLNVAPAAPTNLSLTESLYAYQSQIRSKLFIDWQGVAGVNSYLVKYRKDSGNWTTVTRQNSDYEIFDTTPGFFEISVYSLSASGQSSVRSLSGSITALGKTAAPSDVTGFSYAIDTDLGLLLTWSPIPDIDAYGYEIRRGPDWSTATLVTTVTATTYKVGYLDDGNYTYLVKAIDTSGSYSINAVSTTASFASAAAPTVAATLNGSNVILSWTSASGSLATKVYELRYGATYATASVLATIQGTTYTIRAEWTGARVFWVAAIDPRGRYGAAGSTSFTISAPPQPSISSTISSNTLVLSWAAVKGTIEAGYYEVRRGSTFATATSLGAVNSTSHRVTLNWLGTQAFWVVAYDVNDTIGTPASATITVTAPSQPTVTQQVIDNNVLLRWSDATQTLPVVNYEVRRGATWATATVIGLKQGGFTTILETQAGVYTYWVAGVDAAGNYGTPGSVAAIVNQPPDYVLKYNLDSTFSGTKTNATLDSAGLLASLSTTETWQSHFTSRGWTTLQDQITAGFAYYGIPSQTSGSYEETIDYGAVLAGTKVTATLTSTNIAGATVVTPTISVRKLSTDPWTNYAGLSQVYATQFQYFKIRYDFTSAGGDDLLLVTGLNIRLDAKLRDDSGNGTAVSTDAGGTAVTFNVAFADVDSISVTPLATSSVVAVYDFTDVPNPTSFKVLLFNSSGSRVSGAFSWSARGV
jgi:predicted phage tail protein